MNWYLFMIDNITQHSTKQLWRDLMDFLHHRQRMARTFCFLIEIFSVFLSRRVRRGLSVLLVF
jgi:Ni,Fe-hydrogenase I cytochrome b subunit